MLEKLFDLKPKKYGIYYYLELLPMLLKWNKVKLIVWGLGPKAYVLNNYLEKIYNIIPSFFIEADSDSESRKLFQGHNVVTQDEFRDMNSDNYFAIIAVHGDIPDYVRILLKEKGSDFIIDATAYTWSFKPVWYVYFKKHIDEIEYFYYELNDIRSRNILEEYLKAYIIGDRYKGEELREEIKYFGFDESEKIFEFNSKDVWLNVGGCIGDTLYQAAKNDLVFKKIISIEADDDNFRQLKHSIKLMPDRYKEIIKPVHMFLDNQNSIDRLYSEDGITFINLDIEGAELNVLQGATSIIQTQRPILAISLYHRAEDLVEIPRFIRNNYSKYKLYLRKYPTVYFYYFDGVNQVSETVLYVVPEERLII